MAIPDFDLMLNKKSAVSIFFGEDKDNFFEIVLVKSMIYEGAEIKSTSRDNYKTITSTASLGGKTYYQSSKHHTYISMVVEEVNPSKKTALLRTEGLYTDPNSGMNISFSAELNISDDKFDNFTGTSHKGTPVAKR